MELMDWLQKRIWPLEASHDEESIYYSAMLGIGEMIQSGTTSIVDMETVHHAEFAFQAILQSGIRALSGKVMMDKGKDVPVIVSVSLGADGAPCNNNLDMFNEMRLAALIRKPLIGPTALNAKRVLSMATIGGARAIGMENEIGSIEVGKKADLAILNLNDFHVFPSFDVDPISRIVYSATRADVETTIVNGQVLMENRCLKTMDKSVVLREANQSIKRLVSR